MAPHGSRISHLWLRLPSSNALACLNFWSTILQNFFQAAFFAAPRLIWKGLESGAMDDLVKAVNIAENVRKQNALKEERKEGQAGGDAAERWLQARKLRGVIFSMISMNLQFYCRGVNCTYATASVVCEFLYGLNIVIQWWMLDRFLGRWPCLKF